MSEKEHIKEQILKLTKEYYDATYGQIKTFTQGDRISYSGRVFDEREIINLVDSALEFWLTAGRYADEFERKLSEYLGIKHCALVNSGSSANLIAFMALTAHELGERRIKRGDEVITVAAGFPTTIAPIIQYGAVPVFVDISIPQMNIDVSALEQAVSEKTKAVMLAHTLGNPFDVLTVKEFCERHNLWLIEDNCDALGSEVLFPDNNKEDIFDDKKGNLSGDLNESPEGKLKKTGTIGDIGTSSFYPPHHITMGEGGAVYTDNDTLHKIIISMRDWGRDCFCKPGQDGSCGHRYDAQFGLLPRGYDHKYVYSHFGYNLKATDMQAAVGCAQLDKLYEFTKMRRENWQKLDTFLSDLKDVFILPEALPGSRPSWFGYILTVREDAGFSRNDLSAYLEKNNIQTRNLFAGNIIKHPCFDEYRDDKKSYRIVGDLKETDRVMRDSFWIGVYPGMTDEKLKFMADKIREFVQNNAH